MNKSLLALMTTAVLSLSSASLFAADFAGTKDDAKAMEKKADADYKVAKETCKPMKGDEEKACMKKAKVEHEVAEAHAKGIHEMAEAKTDKEKAKVQAKYDKKMADEQMKASK
ncbi:MAG: cell envelope biogenesis protein TolA [Ideonella sp.]